MSPRSPRYPSPASGDDAAPSGRHRRPETLAEVVHSRPMSAAPAETDPDQFALTRAALTEPSALYRALAEPTPSSEFPTLTPRSRAARSGKTARSETAARSKKAAPSSTTSRRSEATTGPRHSRQPGGRSETRRPVTGSHRAPGTLPIESWLLLGKKRQQILLASLVAAALLLVGIPMRQQGIDAVDAAAARTVGVHIGKNKATDKDSKPAHEAGAADPRTTSPAPKPSGSASPKAPAAEVKLPTGDLGPGHSLRTTGSKSISLTFDDGPDPVQTPKILALLAKYQVKATFCLIGSNVQKHPEIVREIVAAGHTLCNHTWNHSLTIGKDEPEKIEADLERTSAAIRAAVPDAQIPFFRAPGGNFTDRLVDVAKAQGMTSLYWQVDPRDWDHPKGETDTAHINRVMSEILRSVKPGSIILSHDFNQPDTIQAYSKLLPWLTSNFTTTIPGEPAGHAPATATPSTSPPAATPGEATPTVTPNAPDNPAGAAGDS
jgi:peptidoglycan/xylan/chitin deacetylase (PgdA/CDA1 family)